jgi:hypothetical protein
MTFRCSEAYKAACQRIPPVPPDGSIPPPAVRGATALAEAVGGVALTPLASLGGAYLETAESGGLMGALADPEWTWAACSAIDASGDERELHTGFVRAWFAAAECFDVVLPFEGCVLGMRPPMWIKRDREGTPHADDAVAVAWADGSYAAFVHGKRRGPVVHCPEGGPEVAMAAIIVGDARAITAASRARSRQQAELDVAKAALADGDPGVIRRISAVMGPGAVLMEGGQNVNTGAFGDLWRLELQDGSTMVGFRYSGQGDWYEVPADVSTADQAASIVLGAGGARMQG